MWSNMTPTGRCSFAQFVVQSAGEQPSATAMTWAISASYSSAKSDAVMKSDRSVLGYDWLERSCDLVGPHPASRTGARADGLFG